MARKPKQQSFNKDTASAGKMNQRELVTQNPMTPFGGGFTAPAKSGGSSTAPLRGKAQVKPVNYKSRKITALPDAARVSQSVAGKVPMLAKPTVKKDNVKRM